METDHIFICAAVGGAAADELVAAGFAEGSRRRHVGQGTANRKFYVENFFLEILWAADEQELASELIQPTFLRERVFFQQTGASPFGLCLVNTPDTDQLFAGAVVYQPAYFPPGKLIEVLPNQSQPALPWTFRLPFKGSTSPPAEPLAHPNGIQRLTQATFEVAELEQANAFVNQFQHQPALSFELAPANLLRLTFDHQRQGKTRHFIGLPLIIHY